MKGRQIKDVVLLSENQIGHWVRTYMQEGLEGLMAWRYTGKPCALDESQQAVLKQALEQRLFSQASEVQAYVSETFHQTYSIRGMQYLLKRLGYSFKKTKRLPGKQPDQKAQAAFKKNTSSSEPS
jgi:transposase